MKKKKTPRTKKLPTGRIFLGHTRLLFTDFEKNAPEYRSMRRKKKKLARKGEVGLGVYHIESGRMLPREYDCEQVVVVPFAKNFGFAFTHPRNLEGKPIAKKPVMLPTFRWGAASESFEAGLSGMAKARMIFELLPKDKQELILAKARIVLEEQFKKRLPIEMWDRSWRSRYQALREDPTVVRTLWKRDHDDARNVKELDALWNLVTINEEAVERYGLEKEYQELRKRLQAERKLEPKFKEIDLKRLARYKLPKKVIESLRRRALAEGNP